MDLKTIEEKIRSINDSSSFNYKLTTPREKEILSKTVKLNEEVGELCNDILSILRLQRKSKLERFDRRNIYAEFADVFITLSQLAIASNVDLNRAIVDKLKTISDRIEKETTK